MNARTTAHPVRAGTVAAVVAVAWIALLVVPAGATPAQAEHPVGALALEGSATTATPAGGVIEGSVTVTNVGTEDLVRAALTINSSVDETLTGVVVPTGWTCRDVAGVAGQSLFCDAGAFAVGAASTFAFTTAAADGLAVGTVVTRTITANAESPVLDEQPELVLTTTIVGASLPVVPAPATPRFTG
jgi:hypothetical protein